MEELKVTEVDMSKRPTLVLQYDGRLSQSAMMRLREQITSTFSGSRVIVLEEGLRLNSVLMNDLVATDGY